MKTRGTRGGILLSVAADDNLEALELIYAEHKDLFSGKVMLELSEKLPWTLVQAIAAKIEEAGGELLELRPPTSVTQVKAETKIISRTIRSGGLVEANGSLIVLGDVNAGAELVAEDDIIVIGTLRGIAHAGVTGNERAIIWAQRILSPQLRIAGALAQSSGDVPEPSGPEIAHLKEGQIVLRPWDKQL